MAQNYKLTIAIITMNRAEQLRNAVKSCVQSSLPKDTQFVIVDNGSTDETETVIQHLKKTVPYDLIYHKEAVNLGAGLGRNVCFDLSLGEYLFFLDDDAQISEGSREVFFTKSLAYMDKNQKVATLTTNIIDKVIGERQVKQAKKLCVDGLRCAYTFQEGTVFMRKSAFSSPLFMNIMYGAESLSVSTRLWDEGYYSVYDPDIYIDHMPQIDKWHGERKEQIAMLGVNNLYIIKKVMYPRIFTPILWLTYKLRMYRHQLKDRALIQTFRQKNREFYRENKIRRVKMGSVLKCFREFGLTTF